MRLRVLAGVALGCVLLVGQAIAQDKYPSKPIRMVVPFAVGGPTDIVARLMGAKMGELLGQQVIVDNRPGAGGNLGADIVAKAPPDGYTLLMATVSTHAINPGLYKKMPYDPVKDFEPIAQIGVTPAILGVNKSVPVKTPKELVDLIKANPGKYSYGSSGMGSILHLCGESFKMMAGGLDLEHVPYRGSGPMMNDLAAGQIPIAFDGTPTILPQIQAGTVRPLAVATATRARAMPDLPTMQEFGFKGYECYTWNAIFAPAKTPKPIVAQLEAAIHKALEDPTVFKRLQDAGIDPTPGRTSAQLSDFVKAELAKWAPIIKASGAEVD
ncbi:MAG: Bug family tripartite tricarboxylate transporter substrate binding protein [Acetobacteraceae bacterium]